MVKTEYRDVETEKLMKMLDKEYVKIPKKYIIIVGNIVEMNLELEMNRCNM